MLPVVEADADDLPGASEGCGDPKASGFQAAKGAGLDGLAQPVESAGGEEIRIVIRRDGASVEELWRITDHDAGNFAADRAEPNELHRFASGAAGIESHL